jgi:hypothetical protein
MKLEFLDLYNNKLDAIPLWDINSSIKSVDFEQNVFSTESITEVSIIIKNKNYVQNNYFL